jgi:acetolactate decarboxylase
VSLDAETIGALHLSVVAQGGAPEAVHEGFQTSTLEALLDGRYEGDVTIGELRRHGDLGLGTLDALDGELAVVDGAFWRADVDGDLHRVDDGERTPFAVVTRFEPDEVVEVGEPLDHDGLLALVERHVRPDGCAAIRVDGRFELVHARSVPRQQPPYRPLAEVAGEQHTFDLRDLDATLVGFRFPSAAGGVNVPGHHLHVVSADRRRGGHVLHAALQSGTVAVDRLDDLHMELPPGVELPHGSADLGAIDRVERQG